MSKKTKAILTPKDLSRAIRTAKEKDVRDCLRRIALDAFEEVVGILNSDKELNSNKELGSDFITEVVDHLNAYGFCPTED